MEVNEPQISYNKRKYTIEEYTEMEKNSDVKHEYYQGEIFAMAGNKSQHNVVTGNLFGNLWTMLRGRSCRPYNADTRIYIEKSDLCVYPDLSVFCTDLLSYNDDDYNFLNPTIIFETLSPSTRDYDKTGKFAFYRNIPTLKEYVMVEPEVLHIEAFHINEHGFWELREYRNVEETLLLDSIRISLRLRDIYEGTKVLEQLINKK